MLGEPRVQNLGEIQQGMYTNVIWNSLYGFLCYLKKKRILVSHRKCDFIL